MLGHSEYPIRLGCSSPEPETFRAVLQPSNYGVDGSLVATARQAHSWEETRPPQLLHSTNAATEVQHDIGPRLKESKSKWLFA